MLFRFSKIFNILVGFSIYYSFLSIYGYENLNLEWFIKLFIFYLLYKVITYTFNWICFGFFKNTLFMSKQTFENYQNERNKK